MLDWQTGAWQRQGTTHHKTWRMTVASDWAPLNEHEQVMLNDPASIYGDLLPVIRASDLSVVNVEAVLGDAGKPIPKAGPALRGDVRTVRSLTEANFEVACLANNHIMDFGTDGLRCTLDVLASNGLDAVGAGFDESQIRRPVIREVQSTKVAIINCAEGESGRSVYGEPGVFGLDVAVVTKQIADLKDSGQADAVVVVFHGGRENSPVPPPYVVRSLRQIAEAGADAVVGHHPHVPQAVEIHRGVPIAYSLGNFVFWWKWTGQYLYQRVGYLLHLDFAGRELVRFELTPYHLGPEGVARMNDGQVTWFYQQMAKAAKPLERIEDIQAVWAAFIEEHGMQPALDNLKDWINRIETEEDPAAAAAIIKNVFFTPAHAELYWGMMDRIAKNEYGSAPQWAKELVTTWWKQPFEGTYPEMKANFDR